VVENREVVVKGLPDALSGMKVAVMCDWHAGRMMVGGNWLGKRIDQVMAHKPDLILLNGDLFDQGTGPDEMIPAMRRLAAPYGVFAVRGNHDTLPSKGRDVTGEILKAVGIPLLQNEHLEVADGLLLAGIDDLTRSRHNPGEGDFNLNKALSGRPDKATILLSHTPWMVDQAAAAGVDLMLSGHTHNGQIWPFNYLVKVRYPHIVGEYDIRGMPLLVSRGTGTWGPRMRLWQRGEITLITLRSR
jgi:predicted MPP superfamily phosphohydrolase